MKQNFTPSDLIRFLYKETSNNETNQISEALRTNAALHSDYKNLLEVYRTFPKVKFRPSRLAINNILSHSANTFVGQH